jgi:hypothetical protein
MIFVLSGREREPGGGLGYVLAPEQVATRESGWGIARVHVGKLERGSHRGRGAPAVERC